MVRRDPRSRRRLVPSSSTPGCRPATAGATSISRSPRRTAGRHRRRRRSLALVSWSDQVTLPVSASYVATGEPVGRAGAAAGGLLRAAEVLAAVGAARARCPSACPPCPAASAGRALVAGLADGPVLLEDQAELGVVVALVGLLGHGEPAGHHVGVDHQDLPDALEVLDHDLVGGDQVVDQLAEVDPVLLAGTCAARWRWPSRCRSASGGTCRCRRRVPLNRARSRAKLRIAEPLSTWVCSTTRESRISAVVTSKLAFGGLDERARGVDDLADARAGVLERGTRLGDHRAQVGLRHRLTRLSRLVRISVVDTGICGLGGVDLRAVLEVGTVVGLRLELDVLLADGRLVADQRDAVLRDLVVALVDRRAATSTPSSVSFIFETWPMPTPR